MAILTAVDSLRPLSYAAIVPAFECKSSTAKCCSRACCSVGISSHLSAIQAIYTNALTTVHQVRLSIHVKCTDKTHKCIQAEAEIVPESMCNFSAFCRSKGEPPRRPRLATQLCGAWRNVEQQEHCQRGALPFRGLHEALPCGTSGPTALEEAAIAHIVTAKSVRGDRKHHITLHFAHLATFSFHLVAHRCRVASLGPQYKKSAKRTFKVATTTVCKGRRARARRRR